MSRMSHKDITRIGPRSQPTDLGSLRSEMESLLLRLSLAETASKKASINDPAETQLVQEIIKSRRRRDAIFGADIFGEPAWDLLLELYVAQQQQRRVTISEACRASASPPTTGLRWIGQLEEKGWLVREADRCDGRRVWVRLTDEACAKMHDYFLQLAVKAA